MKRFYLSKLFILIAVLSVWCSRASAQVTLLYTGSPVQYTVPLGVFSITVDAQGAAGGKTTNGSPTLGKGGRVQCTLATTPGSVLEFRVGGQGATGDFCCTPRKTQTGGYNGGGNGCDYGSGGGGASDIRVAPYSLSERLVVAGGGGGMSYYCGSSDAGGAGGGLTAANGFYCGSFQSSMNGGGGTQTAGGSRATNGSTTVGTFGVGGDGDLSSYYYGVGGGGGYYGGGGGYSSGGGGGSSYTDATLATAVTHTPGFNSAAGTIIFTANCTPPTAGVVNGAPAICLGLSTPYTTTISAGGKWTSTNTAVATVDSVGTVTSVSAGTATISYGVVYSCGTSFNSKTITINPPPTPIIGNLNACLGKPTDLSDATPGGTWSSSNISVAKVGSSTGTVTGVSLATATITYKLPTTCYTTFTQLVNNIPNQFIVSAGGTGQFCLGGTGVHILMTGSETSTNYDIYNASNVKIAGPYPGSGASYDFGLQTSLGANTVVATYVATGCSNVMSGTAVIANAPLPPAASIEVAGGGIAGGYCDYPGATGISVIVKSPSVGISYQLYKGAAPVGTAMTSTGADIDFGPQTFGVYKVIGTNTTTGCVNDMANTVTISLNPLPNIYTVYGGGSYCEFTGGRRDTLSGSEVGVNYELFLGTSTTGIVKSGTGGVLDFGLVTLAGSYTAVATNPTTTCSSIMAGSASIVVNPLPTPYTVGSPKNQYCVGTSGAIVNLSSSDYGVDYQLKDLSGNVGTPEGGVGGSFEFFGRHLSGTYSVSAMTKSTGCVNNMTGTVTISAQSLPNPFIISDGGSYCAGGTGKPVTISGTEPNTNYQLLVNGTPVGAPVAGGSGGFSFPAQKTAGWYSVIANNTSTGCVGYMSDSVAISINALPSVDTVSVTQGGNYCVGGSGVKVSLKGSSSSNIYQLYLNGVPVTDSYSPAYGTGAPINFGMRTATGLYTVGAVNTLTCASQMAGSALVAITPLPTPFNVTGGGPYCIGTSGNNVLLSFSESGVNYQLFRNSTPLGSLLGTGGTLDFGPQSGIGNYTVSAVNTSTTCANNMSGSVNVSTTPLPIAYNVTGGGNYCSGTPGAHVYLSASNVGINYQLYNGSVPMGGTLHGTGYTLDFGLQTVSGTYKVVATNATSGCMKDMTGSKNVDIVLAPNDYSITGGGSYCTGGTGKKIGLAGSDLGVTYQLWNGTTFVGSMPGTGSPLDFGLKTTVGNYTIKGINDVAGCETVMSGTDIITLNPAPVQYTVSGGGSFCSGGIGSHVYLSGSNAGIDYNLNNSISGAVTSVHGTGLGIDFGALTNAGTYTVVAVNTTTNCSAGMMASAILNVIPTPALHKVIGGGAFCAGGTGVSVKLDGSESGIRYQLYNGTTPIGLAAWGVNDTLDLGLQSSVGTYTVKATNPATGCGSSMTADATVTVNPVLLPSVTVSSDTGRVVCTGTSVTYTAMPVNEGTSPIYEWHSIVGSKDSLMTSTSPVATFIPGTTGEVIKVVLHSNAVCSVVPAAADSMVMTVRPNGKPTVAISSAPGLTVCPGTPVTLAVASPAFGGTAATYKWTKTGTGTVLSTSKTYSFVPANNDKISLEMTSNDQCATTAVSDPANVTLTVQTVLAPVFTIESNPTTLGSIAQGQTVTLKAVVTANGGTSQSYQWVVNGTPLIGETSNTLVSNQFFNNDSVSCIVTGNGDCGAASSAKSAIIKVHNLGASHVANVGNDIRIMPNPNKGTFTVKGTLATVSDEEVTFEITNMLGQIVYKDNVTAHAGQINRQVQLGNNLANGMYILNVHSGNDNAAFHFVIEQ